MEVNSCNFFKMCRTCMKTNLDSLQQIFDSKVETLQELIGVSEVLAAITGISISLADQLPSGICSECLEILIKAYNFQKMCIKSDMCLKSTLTSEMLVKERANAVMIDEMFVPKGDANPSQEQQTSMSIVKVEKPFDDYEDKLRTSATLVVTQELDSHKINGDAASKSELEFNTIKDSMEIAKEYSDSSMSFNGGNDEDAKSEIEIILDALGTEIEKPNPRNKRNACFNCEACGKSFDRQHRLNRHMNVHKVEGRPHECKQCKRRFSKEAHLQRHAITHEKNFQEKTQQCKQNPDGYKCPECPRKFLKQESLASHMRTHRKNTDPSKNYQCDICSKVFERLYRLTRHRKLHEENRKLICDLCGKTFGLSSHLIDHLNKHSGIKPHVCNFCDKSFLQACTLKDHIRTHTGEQPFLCSECGKAFNNASNLRQHQLRHTGIKRYQCSECPSKFSCKSGLSSHMSTHRDQKPYVCDICGSRFTKHYSLKKHERIHTGEKPYKCDYCEMRFNSSDHMKRHRRTHTGEKPYACRYCDRTFAQSNDMIKHLRSHVGENVYKCEQCDASFRLNTELKRHVTEHYKFEKAKMKSNL